MTRPLRTLGGRLLLLFVFVAALIRADGNCTAAFAAVQPSVPFNAGGRTYVRLRTATVAAPMQSFFMAFVEDPTYIWQYSGVTMDTGLAAGLPQSPARADGYGSSAGFLNITSLASASAMSDMIFVNDNGAIRTFNTTSGFVQTRLSTDSRIGWNSTLAYDPVGSLLLVSTSVGCLLSIDTSTAGNWTASVAAGVCNGNVSSSLPLPVDRYNFTLDSNMPQVFIATSNESTTSVSVVQTTLLNTTAMLYDRVASTSTLMAGPPPTIQATAALPSRVVGFVFTNQSAVGGAALCTLGTMQFNVGSGTWSSTAMTPSNASATCAGFTSVAAITVNASTAVTTLLMQGSAAVGAKLVQLSGDCVDLSIAQFATLAPPTTAAAPNTTTAAFPNTTMVAPNTTTTAPNTTMALNYSTTAATSLNGTTTAPTNISTGFTGGSTTAPATTMAVQPTTSAAPLPTLTDDSSSDNTTAIVIGVIVAVIVVAVIIIVVVVVIRKRKAPADADSPAEPKTMTGGSAPPKPAASAQPKPAAAPVPMERSSVPPPPPPATPPRAAQPTAGYSEDHAAEMSPRGNDRTPLNTRNAASAESSPSKAAARDAAQPAFAASQSEGAPAV